MQESGMGSDDSGSPPVTGDDLADVFERMMNVYRELVGDAPYSLNRVKYGKSFAAAAEFCNSNGADAVTYIKAVFEANRPYPYPTAVNGVMAQKAYRVYQEAYGSSKGNLLIRKASMDQYMSTRMDVLGWSVEKIIKDPNAPLDAAYRVVQCVKHNVGLPYKVIYEARQYFRLDPDTLSVYAEENIDLMARVYSYLQYVEAQQNGKS